MNWKSNYINNNVTDLQLVTGWLKSKFKIPSVEKFVINDFGMSIYN